MQASYNFCNTRHRDQASMWLVFGFWVVSHVFQVTDLLNGSGTGATYTGKLAVNLRVIMIKCYLK